MPRTNSPSVSVLSYASTAYTYAGAAQVTSVTFNIALSAETYSSLGYLSGNATATTPLLSGTLFPAPGSGLSATATGIILRWPSAQGNIDLYGYVATGTSTPGTSSFVATIEFNALDFYTNTLFYLSGNKSAVIMDYSGNVSSLDNPFYDIGQAYSNVNGSNITFRTVGEHLRKWNLFG